MTARVAFLAAAVLWGSASLGGAGEHWSDISFGQVYGSVASLSSSPSGVMKDAPNTVVAFSAGRRKRTLVLTDEAGDYIALLEPGSYCISAYTRQGQPLPLGANQLKCIDVRAGHDVRLDVMLAPPKQ
jgi:hypothetical protein